MFPDITRVFPKIHEAGLAADAWPAAMKELTDVLGVAGSACIIFGKESGRVDWLCFYGLSAGFQSKYIDHYARSDPFLPLLRITTGWPKLSECIPRSLLARSEWYNDFVLACGVRDMLGSLVFDSPSHSAVFGIHQKIGRSIEDSLASTLETISDALHSATLKQVENLSGLTLDKIHREKPTSGTRFYFHVTNGRKYPDKTGTIFSSREQAIGHAWKIGAELGRDKVWDGFTISMADEEGHVIARIPIPQ